MSPISAIFLVVEMESGFIRFHAMQSPLLVGTLRIIANAVLISF